MNTVAEKLEYRVVNVEETDAPDGTQDQWHRYTIQRGHSKIEGMQKGKLRDVTTHAESFAESLNERINKRSYGYGSKTKK